MTYIDSLASIKWFVSAGRPDPDAAVASDLSDAWDGYREQWNARSMDIFDQQARRIELEAQARFGDELIEQTFERLDVEICPMVWAGIGSYLAERGEESGVGAAIAIDLLPVVQRDLAWAFFEQLFEEPGCFTQALSWYRKGRRLFGWISADPPHGKPVIL